jgi:hypothetical protein
VEFVKNGRLLNSKFGRRRTPTNFLLFSSMMVVVAAVLAYFPMLSRQAGADRGPTRSLGTNSASKLVQDWMSNCDDKSAKGRRIIAGLFMLVLVVGLITVL